MDAGGTNLRLNDDEEPIDSELAAVPSGQDGHTAKRKGGRPKGSKNRVTAEARALLNGKLGMAALGIQLRVAAGLPIRRRLKGGSYETVMPAWDDVLATGKELLKYQLPQLKATDLTTNGEALPAGPPAYADRHVARAILSALDGRRQGMDPDDVERLEMLVRDHEVCEGPLRSRKESAEAADHPSSASGAADEEQASTSSASPDGFDHTFFTVLPGGKSEPSTPAPPVVGAFEELSGTGAGIELRSVDRDGNERWGVMDGRGALMSVHPSREKAEAKCRELVEARRI